MCTIFSGNKPPSITTQLTDDFFNKIKSYTNTGTATLLL